MKTGKRANAVNKKISNSLKNKFIFKGDRRMSKEDMNQKDMNQEELNKEELNQEESDKDEVNPEESDTKEAEVIEEAEDAEAEGESEEAEAEDKKKKKDPKDEKIEELQDKVKRQLAEFENFRNRTDKEKSQMYEMGAKSVIEKILPVIDNFERGLEHAPAEGDPFADGMRMVYKQMLTELEGIGVKAIEAVGNDFDPNIHNAVMQVASEEYESGKVAQELQKGYMYRDTMVRPSMVAVVE